MLGSHKQVLTSGSAGERPQAGTFLRPVDQVAAPYEMGLLMRRWQTARNAQNDLPPYEEIALGSLGRLSDHLALVRTETSVGYRFLRAGSVFEKWVGRSAVDLALADVRTELVRSLNDLFDQALLERQPSQAVVHTVGGGMIGSYNVTVLPLASRWGSPLLLASVHPLGTHYSLVDEMFEATGEGLVALSIKRDQHGAPTDFRIVAINQGAAKIMRRPVDELRWQYLSELFLNVGTSGLHDRLLRVSESGSRDNFEIAYPLPEGGALSLQIGASAMGDLLTVTLTDIGPLKAREDFFRTLFDNNPVPMWIFDPVDLRFLSVNAAALEHYGYERDAFLSMSLLDIRPHRDHARLLETVAKGEDVSGTERLWSHIKANGEAIEVLSYARVIDFEGRPARLVAVVDVTERRQAEARISYMAHHDALTDLPNRVLFLERLAEDLSRAGKGGPTVAVHYVDLDLFKAVNDTLGHAVGDLLLKKVALRMRGCLAETDFVARLGGDEFAIIQTDLVSNREASDLAERLIDVISQPYLIEGNDVVVGASVGIALSPYDGRTSDELLRSADLALYRAKQDGRRALRFFETAMNAKAQARRIMESDLRNALTAGEFELYFQPLVSASTGKVTGFEALVRWNHPDRGQIPPIEFIPLAEETGLIVPIGDWVLRRACAEAATWEEPIRVAVNLSTVQFKSGSLLTSVMSALANSGLPADRLELEITESVLLKESVTNIEVLHRLRELGVRIALDDFGTGYSSLSYLRSFPFDKIKIDKSFVENIEERGDCLAIVRAVIGLGASLGVHTTAEGVETIGQLNLLQAEGCTEIQGYIFSPPRPACEAQNLVNSIGNA